MNQRRTVLFSEIHMGLMIAAARLSGKTIHALIHDAALEVAARIFEKNGGTEEIRRRVEARLGVRR